VQTLLHLPLNVRQPGFHRLDHLGLGIGLRVRDGAQPPGELVLALPEQLHRVAKPADLARQVLGHARRAPGPDHHHDQKDKDQCDHGGRAKPRQHQRIGEIEGDTSLAHVRPNNLSMSASLSST